MGISEDVKTRFFEKVKMPKDRNECWEWTACCKKYGYGWFSFNRNSELAHRISWMIHYGDIPEGRYICHHCDNPCCVNPDHLFIGDHASNMYDKARKGRCSRLNGESNGNSKLTNYSVRKIRELLNKGMKGYKIAPIFNVSDVTIYMIKNGHAWQHITI